MSAGITLKTVWINLTSDLSQFNNYSQLSSLKIETSQPGDVRRYAGGRMRVIRKAGIARAISLTLPACSRAQIAFLEANVGQIVCVRDDRGRKIFATYLTVPVDENPFELTGNVSLALSEVTATDIV